MGIALDEDYMGRNKKKHESNRLRNVTVGVFILSIVALASILYLYLPTHIAESNASKVTPRQTTNTKTFFDGMIGDSVVGLEDVNGVFTLTNSTIANSNGQVEVQSYSIPATASNLTPATSNSYLAYIGQGAKSAQEVVYLYLVSANQYRQDLASLGTLVKIIDKQVAAKSSYTDLYSNVASDVSNTQSATSSFVNASLSLNTPAAVTTIASLNSVLLSDYADLYTYDNSVKYGDTTYIAKQLSATITSSESQMSKKILALSVS